MERSAVRSYYESKINWRELPRNIDPTNLLFHARSGDNKEAREQLILSYVRMAGAIAAGFAHKWSRHDECFAIAMAELVESIDYVITTRLDLGPEFLAPYLNKRIAGALKDFVSQDHVIRPPLCSKWFADGVKKEGGAFIYRQIGIRSSVATIESLNLSEDETPTQVSGPNTCEPEATQSCAARNLMITDYIQHRVFTTQEKAVLTLLVEGNTYQEIGDQIGVSAPMVHKIITKHIAPKIKRVLTGEW